MQKEEKKKEEKLIKMEDIIIKGDENNLRENPKIEIKDVIPKKEKRPKKERKNNITKW